MAKLIVKTGSTSRLEHVFILDSTSTTGAGKTGLTNASVTLYYWRPGNTTIGSQTGTLSAGTLGTWSSFGFKEVDATNLPGLYEVGIPDAVFAASANHAVVMIKGTGIAPVVLEYQLVAFDPDSGSNLGLAALPTATTGTAGAIITSGTGTAQLSVSTGTVTTGAISANAITNASIADSAITIRLSTDGTASKGRIVTGTMASDVWNAVVSTYDATSTNTTATMAKAILKSDAQAKNGDVTMYSIAGSNGIDVDLHRIANDKNAVTNLKAMLINTSTITLGAQFNSTGNTAVATATMGTDVSTGVSPTASYWIYQAGLNAQDAASNTSTIASTAFVESIGDALLNRNLAGGSNTGRLVKEALYALRNKSEISGSTLNVYNATDGAIAWSATVSSSATANPVTGIDPP